MKILVISDTHGRLDNAKMIIERLLPNHLDAVLHCGDYIHDVARLEQLYQEVPFYAVQGNCDMIFGYDDKVVVLDDVPIFITHGHRYDVKWGSYDSLIVDAAAHDARIAVCGHSHEAYIDEKEGILVMNPGSITLPRDSYHPSYGLIDVEKGQILGAKILQILKDQTVRVHPIMTH